MYKTTLTSKRITSVITTSAAFDMGRREERRGRCRKEEGEKTKRQVEVKGGEAGRHRESEGGKMQLKGVEDGDTKRERSSGHPQIQRSAGV